MKLSEDLVREFAEVTNDTKKDENPEPTCYGTASFQGEQGYVQIDGSDFLTPATFTVGAEQGDRVLVVIKGRKALVIGNITNPVLIVGTLKATNGIVVNGWLTTNENRKTYNDWGRPGLTFSNGGIGAYGGPSKYWYLTNAGELFANSATITGAITATSLNLTADASVPAGKVTGLSKVATSGDAYDILNLKPIATSGLASDVGGLAPIATNGEWSSLVHNPMIVYLDKNGILTSGTFEEGKVGFVISQDGLLQASNAIIYGTIFASAGKIGGLALDSKSIHTLDVGITSNANSSIGLSSENFTRTVAGASRTGLRLAIGSGFGVDYTGKLYASGALIRGDIEATSLNLTTAAATSLQNTIDGRISANAPDLTVYIKKDGTLGTIGEAKNGFKVSSAGVLQASNAIIYGTIYASAGKIGGLEIASNSIHTLNVAVTSNASASVALSSADFNRTVAGAPRTGLRFAIGSGFGVDKTGKLYASGAVVRGDIEATSLNLTTTAAASLQNTIDGRISANAPDLTVYIKKDGTLGTVADGSTGFKVSTAGLLQASNAVIYGKLYSSEGTIGGITIASNGIRVGETSSVAAGSFALTSSDFTRTINNTSRTTLRFAIGSNFGVAKDGTIYATGADITGAITATTLTLGKDASLAKGNTPTAGVNGFKVDTNGLLQASNAIIWGTINATAGAIGGLTLKDGNLYTGSHTSLTATNDGIFIGATGISLGNGGKFRVTNTGALTATSAEITGKITATSGKIGDFTVDTSGALYSGSHSTWNDSANDGIFLSKNYISIGKSAKFYIKADGTAYCNGAAFNIVYPNALSTYTEVTALNFYLGGTQSTNMVGRIYGKIGSQSGLHISSPYWGIIWIDGDMFVNGLYPTTMLVDETVGADTVYSNSAMYTFGNFSAGETNIYALRVNRVKNAYASVCLRVNNSSTGYHGVYSDTGNRWMIYRSASSSTVIIPTTLHIDKTVDGNLSTTNGNGSTTSPKNVAVGGVSPVFTFAYKNMNGYTKTVQAIRAFGDDESSTSNGIVLLGSNTGATIITSGEEAPYLIRTKGISNNESTYIISDGIFKVFTGASHSSSTTNSITTITGTAKEVISVDTSGHVFVMNYANYLRVAVTTADDDGKRVSALRCDNSTTLSVHGQWGTAGTTYSYKTITSSASDIRLKENIVFSNAKSLALINKIPLYEFDWKDGRHWDVGFVADYIVDVDPRLAIIKKGADEYSSIDTYYMTGHIVKAIQELSILHDDHSDKIKALEKEVADLKSKLSKLTAA